MINDYIRLLCVLQRQFKLGNGNGDWLGTYGFHAPIAGFNFSFQRKDMKIKDWLVLSVVGVEGHLD